VRDAAPYRRNPHAHPHFTHRCPQAHAPRPLSKKPSSISKELPISKTPSNHSLCKTSKIGQDGLYDVWLKPRVLLHSKQYCTEGSLPAADRCCCRACKVQVLLLERHSLSGILNSGCKEVFI